MLDEKHLAAYQKIKSAKNILLVTHVRPDTDALSAVGVWSEILTDWGKNFFSFCATPPPHQLSFITQVEKISSEKSQLDFFSFDLIIVLDCGSLSRTHLTEEIKSKTSQQTIIEFDHHPRVDDYAEIEIRNPSATSTTEILYDFLKINHIKINKKMATAILAGILTDTGNFLYPITTDKAINIASEMQLLGAHFPQILENTWRNKSLPAMKAWGRAMKNLEINKKYNFAFSLLTNEDILETGADEEELEGISGFLSNLYGVKGLVFLREDETGTIKGSLRTAQTDIDVSKLAQLLGGGGHAKASGFAIKGVIKKTEKSWRIV